MPYLTPAELVSYIREAEGVDQSNESEDCFLDQPFYERAIGTASSLELDSVLGIRYPLPLPSSQQVKDLCAPLSWWWAEKMGINAEKRPIVQIEYETAKALIAKIASGEAALIGVDGKPVIPIGGDTSPMPGVQAVRTFVGQRTTTWSN